MQSLARNHATFDGNKRTAWAAAWTFLCIDGIELPSCFDVDIAEELMNEVATVDCDLSYISSTLARFTDTWRTSQHSDEGHHHHNSDRVGNRGFPHSDGLGVSLPLGFGHHPGALCGQESPRLSAFPPRLPVSFSLLLICYWSCRSVVAHLLQFPLGLGFAFSFNVMASLSERPVTFNPPISRSRNRARAHKFGAQVWIPSTTRMVPSTNMALNIKDDEVDRLATELAHREGHDNKTRAIRGALRAQLALLESRAGSRQEQLLNVMRTEIWPLTRDNTAPITKEEREAILGYDHETGV